MDSPSEDQAVTFFRTMVEPTVTEFMAHPADPRRGSLACIALAAQFEHTLAADGQLNGSELRRLIAEVKAEYWAAWGMREAANAFKHVKRDRDETAGGASVTSASKTRGSAASSVPGGRPVASLCSSAPIMNGRCSSWSMLPLATGTNAWASPNRNRRDRWRQPG